jgi:hypothetical protein
MQASIANPAWLKERYWNDRLSTQEIADLAGISDASVRYAMRKHGIPRRHQGPVEISAQARDPAQIDRFRAYLSDRSYTRSTISKSVSVAVQIQLAYPAIIPADREALAAAVTPESISVGVRKHFTSGVNRFVDFLEHEARRGDAE